MCFDEASCHTGGSHSKALGANSQLRTEALCPTTLKEMSSANNHRALEVSLSPAESSDETPAWLTPWLQLVRDPKAGTLSHTWISGHGSCEMISMSCLKLLIFGCDYHGTTDK